ncbi:MAG TPA: hypothetical protein VH680_03915 [Gemmatimonadales bacterium]|jgi:hypothetical protein
MLKPMLTPVLLLAAGAGALHAQTDYYARVGAVGASTLVRDVLVTEILVRQSIAPMLAMGASLPLSPSSRVGLEATLASGGFDAEQEGSESDLGTLRTASLLLGLDGPIRGSLRWRLGLGGILYWPSEDAGIFLEGGPVRFLAGAGLDWRKPVMTSWDLMVSGRYDFHRFSTDELERRGFTQAQAVSRVSLSVGLARAIR